MKYWSEFKLFSFVLLNVVGKSGRPGEGGLVLKIRTHPESGQGKGGLKIKIVADVISRLPLRKMTVDLKLYNYGWGTCSDFLWVWGRLPPPEAEKHPPRKQFPRIV